jgi:hypothetical protein
MGDRSGEFAQCGDASNVCKFGLRFLDGFLSPDPLCDLVL